MNDRWQKIERIYHTARELDGGARAEFLAKACAGDDDLRREVEALLAQADQAGSFLESPAIKVAAGAMAKERSAPGDVTLQLYFAFLVRRGSNIPESLQEVEVLA